MARTTPKPAIRAQSGKPKLQPRPCVTDLADRGWRHWALASQGRQRIVPLLLGLLLADPRQPSRSLLAELGCGAGEIEAFQALSIEALRRLIARSDDWLRIAIDRECLKVALQRVDAGEEEELVRTLLRHGASNSMMTALFGYMPTELAALRHRFGLATSRGRVRMPDDDTREALRQLWRDLAATEPCVRRRLLYLAEQTKLSLATLWGVLRDDIRQVPRDTSAVARRPNGGRS